MEQFITHFANIVLSKEEGKAIKTSMGNLFEYYCKLNPSNPSSVKDMIKYIEECLDGTDFNILFNTALLEYHWQIDEDKPIRDRILCLRVSPYLTNEDINKLKECQSANDILDMICSEDRFLERLPKKIFENELIEIVE